MIMSTTIMIMIMMRTVSIRFFPTTAEEISWWTPRNEPGPEIKTIFETHQMKLVLLHNGIKILTSLRACYRSTGYRSYHHAENHWHEIPFVKEHGDSVLFLMKIPRVNVLSFI